MQQNFWGAAKLDLERFLMLILRKDKDTRDVSIQINKLQKAQHGQSKEKIPNKDMNKNQWNKKSRRYMRAKDQFMENLK